MKLLKPILSLALFASIQASNAANTLTTTTQASAQLQAVCNIGTQNMTFGTLTANTEASATSNVAVTCTKGSSYNITFAYGNPGGSHLVGTNSGDELPYIVEILQTGSFLTISSITGVGSGDIQNYGLQGFILQAEDMNAPHLVPYVTPDNYTDNITATITY